ncbi:hypothetical protein [Streptomyces sp. CB02009]|uniref:hypothetical protein n=1 Tax=Streptomyces sp. CB02009 TaxID=1703938 RepID=UPI0011613F36|nr:hypothetical protein [Streptomyces sp. CB02009]
MLSTLAATGVITLATAACTRLRARRASAATALAEAQRQLRRYTLLRTTGPDGTPVHYASTRPPGTIVTYPVDGHPQPFELTDVPLSDATYAAEPL